MNYSEEWHIIETEGILFHIPTSNIFKVEPVLSGVLKKIFNGESLDLIRDQYKIADNDIHNFFNKIYNVINKTPIAKFIDSEEAIDEISLTLNVANICNLRCNYCAVNYGKYQTFDEPEIMGTETAIMAVDYFKNYFKISSILFYGGEPLLNPKVISDVCKHVTDKKMGSSFALVTNGTILNDEIIKLINKYKINISVSIDGPASINDRLRKYSDGNGTFDDIISNVKKIRENCNQGNRVLATYTEEHKNLGISILELTSFLIDKLSFNACTISPEKRKTQREFCKNEELISSQIINDFEIDEHINTVIDSMLTDYPIFSLDICDKILSFILKEHNQYHCKIARGTFVVNTSGNIYPCQEYVTPQWVMGNIYMKENFIKTKEFVDVKSRLGLITKHKHPVCSKCWLKNLCHGCLKSIISYSSNQPTLTTIYCSYIKKIMESVLIKMYSAYQNKDAYHKLVDNIKKMQEL